MHQNSGLVQGVAVEISNGEHRSSLSADLEGDVCDWLLQKGVENTTGAAECLRV